jgi:hypothetical protein
MSEKRVNFAMSDDSDKALTRVQQATGLNKTDLINRAIVVYAFLDREARTDGKLIVRREGEPDTAIRFF